MVLDRKHHARLYLKGGEKMVEFHATGYGSRFYNGQLPALIHALERIANALEKIAKKEDGSEEEKKSKTGSS